jgi:hypothetical protein
MLSDSASQENGKFYAKMVYFLGNNQYECQSPFEENNTFSSINFQQGTGSEMETGFVETWTWHAQVCFQGCKFCSHSLPQSDQ